MHVGHSRKIQGPGYLPLRHQGFERDQVALDMRCCILGMEVTGQRRGVDDVGTWSYDPHSIGDLIGGLLWPHEKSGDRQIPAWRFAWPVVAREVEGGGGHWGHIFNEGATATKARDFVGEFPHEKARTEARCVAYSKATTVLPVRGVNAKTGAWVPDERFRGLVVTPEADKDGKLREPKFPDGTRGLVLAADEEGKQIELFLPVDRRLVAVGQASDPDFGTMVCDAKNREIDDARSAKLQSAFRVVKMERRQGGALVFGGLPNVPVIALNIGQSRCGDTWGGLVIQRDKSSTVSATRGGVGHAPLIAGGMPTFTFLGRTRGVPGPGVPTPPEPTLAHLSAQFGGPIHVGRNAASGAEFHRLGKTEEGWAVNSAHLSILADYIDPRAEERDGPLRFDGAPDPTYAIGEFPHLVDFIWSPAETLATTSLLPGGVLGDVGNPGRFIWRAWSDLTDSESPRRSGDDTIQRRPHTRGPDDPRPGSGLPPLLHLDPAVVPGPASVSLGSPDFEAPPSRPQIPSVPFVVLGPDPIAGGLKSRRDRNDDLQPAGAPLRVKSRRSDRQRSFVLSSREICHPSIVFRPQFFHEDAVDFRNQRHLADDHLDYCINGVPLVARLESFGKQEGTAWAWTNRFEQGGSRYGLYGTAHGGLCLLPPEVSLEEVRDGSVSASDPKVSRAWLVMPRFARLGFGLPSTDRGGLQDDGLVFRWHESQSNLRVDYVDANGDLQQVAMLSRDGVGLLGFSGFAPTLGGGVGVAYLANADTIPFTPPPSGVILYVASDYLRYLHPTEGVVTLDDRVAVRKNSGGTVFNRRRLNLIESGATTITLADDAVNEEVDVTIDSAGGAGGALALSQKSPASSVVVTAGRSAYVSWEYEIQSGLETEIGAGSTLEIG